MKQKSCLLRLVALVAVALIGVTTLHWFVSDSVMDINAIRVQVATEMDVPVSCLHYIGGGKFKYPIMVFEYIGEQTHFSNFSACSQPFSSDVCVRIAESNFTGPMRRTMRNAIQYYSLPIEVYDSDMMYSSDNVEIVLLKHESRIFAFFMRL